MSNCSGRDCHLRMSCSKYIRSRISGSHLRCESMRKRESKKRYWVCLNYQKEDNMIHFIFRSIWRDQAANERFAKAMWEEHREGMEKKEKEEEERLFREFLEEYKRVAGLLKGIEYEHEE